MSMSDTVDRAVWPPASETERVTDWSAPEAASVTGAGQPPLSASAPAMQVNVTVTGARYQPDALFGPLELTAARIAGAAPQLSVPVLSAWPPVLLSSDQNTG